MKDPASLVRLWRLLLVVLVMGVPSFGTSVAGQSSGEFDIEIEVLPAPEADDPTARDTSPPERTVSAGFSEVGTLPSADVFQTTTFDLAVADHRPNANGWIVKIMESSADDPAEPFVLSRYLRRTVALDGQDTNDGAGPHGTRLSVGQPLDQMTPVIVANPGDGAGTYSIRFAVTGLAPEPDAVIQLTISITSAP